MRIAVFTVQTYNLTPEQTVSELSSLGYDGVEWRITTPATEPPGEGNFWTGNLSTFDIDAIEAEAPRLKSLTESHGLALPTLGTYLDPARHDLVEACCRAAQAIGVPMLRVGLSGWGRDTPYRERVATNRRHWETVVELGRHYGVRILLELHHNSPLPTASSVMRFFEGWGPEDVGVTYDPGNMVHEGWEHPETVVGVLGPYLAHVHVKNARWLRCGEAQGQAVWKAEMCRLREGQVFWPDVLRALQAGGYDGWFATEDFGPGDTREKLADNLALLRQWAAA